MEEILHDTGRQIALSRSVLLREVQTEQRITGSRGPALPIGRPRQNGCSNGSFIISSASLPTCRRKGDPPQTLPVGRSDASGGRRGTGKRAVLTRRIAPILL